MLPFRNLVQYNGMGGFRANIRASAWRPQGELRGSERGRLARRGRRGQAAGWRFTQNDLAPTACASRAGWRQSSSGRRGPHTALSL
jgi:hypothetical protein